MTDTPDDDPSIDPADLWSVTKEKLDNLDNDPVAAGQLANEFASDLARSVHEGKATDTVADPLLKQFARGADMKKSKVEGRFESELEALEEEEEEDASESDDNDGSRKHSILDLLDNRLTQLTIYTPTDASAKPRYEWEFDTGVEVETETEHLAPDSLCQEYHDASGAKRNAGTPDDFEGSWTDYIRDLVSRLREADEKVRVVPVEGVRTHAVQDLRDAIETKPATTDIQTAAQQHRAYVDPEDPDVVQVPSAVIERLLSNFEDCSYNDLQIELDKRKVRAGNVRQTQIGRGVNVRFWQLKREWLDVEVEEDDQDLDGAENGGDTRGAA